MHCVSVKIHSRTVCILKDYSNLLLCMELPLFSALQHGIQSGFMYHLYGLLLTTAVIGSYLKCIKEGTICTNSSIV